MYVRVHYFFYALCLVQLYLCLPCYMPSQFSLVYVCHCCFTKVLLTLIVGELTRSNKEISCHQKICFLNVDFSKSSCSLNCIFKVEQTNCNICLFNEQVKVWCTKQEASVLNIDMKANICCVKYNPGSGNYIAVCTFYSLRRQFLVFNSF